MSSAIPGARRRCSGPQAAFIAALRGACRVPRRDGVWRVALAGAALAATGRRRPAGDLNLRLSRSPAFATARGRPQGRQAVQKQMARRASFNLIRAYAQPSGSAPCGASSTQPASPPAARERDEPPRRSRRQSALQRPPASLQGGARGLPGGGPGPMAAPPRAHWRRRGAAGAPRPLADPLRAGQHPRGQHPAGGQLRLAAVPDQQPARAARRVGGVRQVRPQRRAAACAAAAAASPPTTHAQTPWRAPPRRGLTQGVKQRAWEAPPALDPPALLANVAVVLVGPKLARLGGPAESMAQRSATLKHRAPRRWAPRTRPTSAPWRARWGRSSASTCA